jgi:hypothetical protein
VGDVFEVLPPLMAALRSVREVAHA